MVRVNNTLVCGVRFFPGFLFFWPPTHYRVSDQVHNKYGECSIRVITSMVSVLLEYIDLH